MVPPKPTVGSTDSDTEMSDGKHGTSTNASGYDCVMLTIPKSAVRFKNSDDNDPSSKAAIDHTKRSVGFRGSADAIMAGDDLANNGNDEKMTDFQQQANDNTTKNTGSSSL